MSDNHFNHAHADNKAPQILNLLFKPVTSLLPNLHKKLPSELTEHLSVGSLLLLHPFVVEPTSHMVTKTVQAAIDYTSGYPVDNPFTKKNIIKSFHLRFEPPKAKLETPKILDKPLETQDIKESAQLNDTVQPKIKVDLQSNASPQGKVLISSNGQMKI
jgi:hypothetical protein